MNNIDQKKEGGRFGERGKGETRVRNPVCPRRFPAATPNTPRIGNGTGKYRAPRPVFGLALMNRFWRFRVDLFEG